MAGFVLLYLTLRTQQEDIRAQKKAADSERFETTFFNLLNIQQNITNDLKIFNPYSTSDKEVVQGRKIFIYALKERNRINRCLSLDSYDGMYQESDDDDYMSAVEMLFDRSNLDNDPFFDAVEEEEEKTYKNKLFRRIVNKTYHITEEEWRKRHELIGSERIVRVYKILFEKFDYVLGHYFRNLYHIMKFVYEFEIAQLNKTNKREEHDEIRRKCSQYAKFIQAQMSSFELALLHDNALWFEDTALPLVKHYDFAPHMPEKYLIDKRKYI